MAQHQEAPSSEPAQDPGRVLGTVGLILAIIPCTWFVGLVMCVIAFGVSRTAGSKNQRARIGIIVGVAYLVLFLILQFTGLLPNWLSQFQNE